MHRIPYCTREDVKVASDTKDSAGRNDQIDRAIAGAADTVDELTRRSFAPWYGTRYFDWPSGQYGRSWRLWLDENRLVSLTSVQLRGTASPIDLGYFLLEPQTSGPPYNRIEVDISVGGPSATFGGSRGTQRAVMVTGLWGHTDERVGATTLVASVSGSSGSVGLRVRDSAAVGVGDLLWVEGERMLVENRAYESTGVTLSATLAQQNNATVVGFDQAGEIRPGETLMIDGEKVLVEEAWGSSALVKRAQEGTPLAAHSVGAAVYAPRLLTVKRGQAGSTAVGHTAGVAIEKQVYPALVRQLAIAEAQVNLAQETASFGRTIGSGENARESSGKGLKDLRLSVVEAFGRQARKAAI